MLVLNYYIWYKIVIEGPTVFVHVEDFFKPTNVVSGTLICESYYWWAMSTHLERGFIKKIPLTATVEPLLFPILFSPIHILYSWVRVGNLNTKAGLICVVLMSPMTRLRGRLQKSHEIYLKNYLTKPGNTTIIRQLYTSFYPSVQVLIISWHRFFKIMSFRVSIVHQDHIRVYSKPWKRRLTDNLHIEHNLLKKVQKIPWKSFLKKNIPNTFFSP